MNYKDILVKLREDGHRLTKTRTEVVKLLYVEQKPIAASDVQALLRQRGIDVNKTTIYRELDFLVQKHYIQEIWLNDGCTYYECISNHHHHLICTVCKGIDDIVLQNEFVQEERRIEREMQFKISHHSLEFFGVCARCQ